jgi:single-stranded DNA-specific DHH superfamily exonuclease
MGLHKIKKLLHNNKKNKLKETTHRVGENICQLYIRQGTDNLTKMYRKLKKLNSPKINETIKKWATELNRTFSKEEIQMAKRHMKKCSPSLAIKEIQIKTTLRFHLTPVRIAIIKNTTSNMCWQGCGGNRNPCTLLVSMQGGTTTLEKNLEPS